MEEEEVGDEDGDQEDGYEEEGDGEDVATELHDVETGTTTRRKTRKTETTTCKRWKTKEDECLVDAWKLVTNDSIVGSNQTYGRYWKRVKEQLHETMIYGDYAKVTMDHNWNVMSHRWRTIQAECNKVSRRP